MRNVRRGRRRRARQADPLLPRPPRPLAGADRRRLGRARGRRDRRLHRRPGLVVGRPRRSARPARADRRLRRRHGGGGARLRRPLRRATSNVTVPGRLRQRLGAHGGGGRRRARRRPLGRAARHLARRWSTMALADRPDADRCAACTPELVRRGPRRRSTRRASSGCRSSSPAASTRRRSARFEARRRAGRLLRRRLLADPRRQRLHRRRRRGRRAAAREGRPGHLAAQSASSSSPRLPRRMFARIDHIGVAVEDLDAAIALHQDTYGMALVHRETVTEQGVEAVLLDVGENHVELLRPLSAGHAGRQVPGQARPGPAPRRLPGGRHRGRRSRRCARRACGSSTRHRASAFATHR